MPFNSARLKPPPGPKHRTYSVHYCMTTGETLVTWGTSLSQRQYFDCHSKAITWIRREIARAARAARASRKKVPA